MEPKKKKLGGQQGELMRALHISVDDLIANDEGFIPQEQFESVMKRQSAQWQGFIAVSIFLTLFASGFMGFALLNMPKLIPIMVISLIFFAIAILIGGGALLYRHRLKNELSKSEVSTVQGIAVVNMTFESAQLEINGLKLNTSPDVLRRVQNLQPYVVHYLPESKVILSMEHISEDSNIREDRAQSRLQESDDISDENLNDYVDRSQSTMQS